MSVEKYNPLMIVLHWLVAFILIVALFMGTFVLQEIPNTSPEKIDALKGHMTGGIILLVIMLMRFAVRLVSKKPPHASSGNPALDKLGVAVHYGFYVFVIGMALSGIATSMAAGLPDIVFGGSGTPLPENFNEYGARLVHGIIAKILMLLVVLHIAGALYHQLALKDNLISRMKFGRKK